MFLVNFFKYLIKRFSRFDTWFLENQRRNLVGVFGLFILIAFSATVLVTVTPRPSNSPSTALNTPVPFGTMNKTASLNKSVFNNETGVLELHLTIYDGTVSDQNLVDINKIRFTATTDHGGDQVTGRVVPTSNNTVVIQFKNLNHNFNAVTLIAHDKSINTATIEAPNNVSAESSDKTKTPASRQNVSGKFTINRDKITLSNTLLFSNQRALEISEYNAKIAAQRKLIAKNSDAIIAYQKAVDQQEVTVKKYQAILAQSNESDIQTSIDNARNQTTQIRTQMNEAQSNIQHAKLNIDQYQKTKKQIREGHTRLPKPTDL
ncbi:hypothetical protein [Leuconostoc lactis]|uniref:hypothetical protein n=1 Tax=Leuconostoc lactis TaxID=1246 RepID=UPI00102046AD|nr:hypothetical protein [Leuconostoc lactis]MSB65613.1 hypothetical protein [Leuconostoc lactis]RYS84924.1 hypothetical protein EAI73_08270 [Leuconostoc lactis]